MPKSSVAELYKLARDIRIDILDMVYKAQSGHIGGSFSSTEIVTTLYFSEMQNLDPKDPRKANRDRFVLSKGHACPVWYACLSRLGYFEPEHLGSLRQINSILQGHPDMKSTPGLDSTAGSLGHGCAAATGMALEGLMTGDGRRVYSVLGDGEINEGVVWETAMAAAKYHLDNLVFFVDKNNLQMDGTSDEIMPLLSIEDKFSSFGWHVLTIDGHDIEQIQAALKASRNHKGQPTCIVANTVKGKGVSFMENVRNWHGKAPSTEEYEAARAELVA
ncbi:transketolase [Photobacterium gaetbulicola]|uniref:Transketolase n=1 Tax=Photobacterium gaetbulicola TaxID=1295392 RepID=A0A0B9GH25_9GAMM|nr:transketolase [Photobacterium gaetbulicola]KHT58326.1 transketolase [Photobacterium gaetbulicola]